MPLTIAFSVSDEDLAIIGHEVIDPAGWCERAARTAISHKVERCAARMDEAALALLAADPAVQEMPADRAARLALFRARPEYRARAAREGEALAAEAAGSAR